MQFNLLRWLDASPAHYWLVAWITFGFAVVLFLLGFGHLDRHPGIGARRKLVEHFLADPPDHARPQPLARSGSAFLARGQTALSRLSSQRSSS